MITRGQVGKEVRSPVQIVVVGDPGTGKSSLIRTAETGKFPKGLIKKVLPASSLLAKIIPYHVPVLAMDTSPLLIADMEEKLKDADVVLWTFDCRRPDSFFELEKKWIPYLQPLAHNKLRIIVVGCKLDELDEKHKLWDNFDLKCENLLEKYAIVEACVRCSAWEYDKKPECGNMQHVFRYAVRAVIYPVNPLFDMKRKYLSQPLVRALRRIFFECVGEPAAEALLRKDYNKAVISDEEINENMMVKLHGGSRLTPEQFKEMKQSIRYYLPDGVDSRGRVNFFGFLQLHSLYMLRDMYERTWALVTAFGYDDAVKQKTVRHQDQFVRDPDQIVELTTKAKEFLQNFFRCYKPDEMGILKAAKIDCIFSTELESLNHYKESMQMSVCGGCSLDGILAMFDFVSLREPVKAFSTLINLGYLGTADSALCISRGKRLELEEGKTERSVFQCFMFGPSHAGKSKLLNFFLGRGVSEGSTSTTAERFATVVVDVDEGTKNTLILREISEEETGTFLSDKESLAACDIATFSFERSTDESRDAALKMFKEVHNHCLNSGFGMFPCLLIEDQTDYNGFFTAHLLVEDRMNYETSTDNVLFAPILPYAFQSLDHVGHIFLDIIRIATIQYQRDFRLSNTDMDEDQGRGGTSFVGRERSRSPLAHRIR